MTTRISIYALLLFSLVGFSSCKGNELAHARKPSSEVVPVKTSITVMSWNMRHLGRKSQNLEAVAAFMKDADIVTLQEVNVETGQDALMRLASRLRALDRDERICVALSDYNPKTSDSDERYGYLWRESRITYIKTNGELVVDCNRGALNIPVVEKNADLIMREPSVGTFRARAAGTNFKLVSIHLRPSGKKPQLEVPPLFEAVQEFTGPVIVAGDYNLDSGHSAFKSARDAGFGPALYRTKTSLMKKKRELSKPYDNFWIRGVALAKPAEVINLYEHLKDMEAEDIFNNISDHSPIVGEFVLPMYADAPPPADHPNIQ